jgi:hypothetical protein
MSETEEYGQLAEQALALANDPKLTRENRQTLLEIAMAWKHLAEQSAKPATAASASRGRSW